MKHFEVSLDVRYLRPQDQKEQAALMRARKSASCPAANVRYRVLLVNGVLLPIHPSLEASALSSSPAVISIDIVLDGRIFLSSPLNQVRFMKPQGPRTCTLCISMSLVDLVIRSIIYVVECPQVRNN